MLRIAMVLLAASLSPTSARIAWAEDLQGVARVGGRATANAVVWLEAPQGGRASDGRAVVVSQRNLAFAPKVLAVQVGTTVTFPNDDRVFHNVFSFHDGQRFDLGTYPVGTSGKVVFSRAGVSRVFCNIHPHMAAYVVAVDSPYFAVTGDDGAFALGGVPPGRYTYRAWRSSGDTVTGVVDVPGTAPLHVEWK